MQLPLIGTWASSCHCFLFFLLYPHPFTSFSFSLNLKAFDFIGCLFSVELSSLGSLTLVEDPRGVSLASQAI
jgi:hypothetical protein